MSLSGTWQMVFFPKDASMIISLVDIWTLFSSQKPIHSSN